MYPAVTAIVATPTSRHALAVSMAYSAQMTGSLYVNATLLHPRVFAAVAIASGVACSLNLDTSRDLLMSQFWQN